MTKQARWGPNVTTAPPATASLAPFVTAEQQIQLWPVFLLPRRAGATRPGAAGAASITSPAIPTARTATDVDQLVQAERRQQRSASFFFEVPGGKSINSRMSKDDFFGFILRGLMYNMLAVNLAY